MAETKGRIWTVFEYARVNEKVRQEQWQELYMRSRKCGDKWILDGDLNDIKSSEKKEGEGLDQKRAARALEIL